MQSYISAEITIKSPAEQVWNLLAQLTDYNKWNPFIRSAQGELAVGARLRLKLQIPNGIRMTIRPKLLVVKPAHEIRWIGHLLVPGLFDGDHRLLIEQKGVGKVRLIQQERFSGLLLPVFGKWIGAGALHGFRAMNRAARKQLEAKIPIFTS